MLNTEERTWDNAPQSVRTVRVLAILSLIGNGLCVVGLTAVLISSHDAQALMALFLVFAGLQFAFQLWMLKGLREGKSYAYYIQMVLSFLGLPSFPVGTLLYGYILYLWFKPETKAWFGI